MVLFLKPLLQQLWNYKHSLVFTSVFLLQHHDFGFDAVCWNGTFHCDGLRILPGTSDWTRLLEPSHHLALYSYPNALGHNGSIPDHCSDCSLCFSPESSVHVKWTEQMSTDMLNQRKLTPLWRGMEFIKSWEVIKRVPGKQMFGGNTGSYGFLFFFFYWMMFKKLGSTFPVDLMPFQTQK